MSRKEETAGSRERLLSTQTPHDDNDDQQSSSSDLDLDELDEPTSSSSLKLRGGWQLKKGQQDGKKSARERRLARDQGYMSKVKRKGGCCRQKTCCLILAILLAGLAILVASVGWMFKTHAPPDGQSPPWYPTPNGGTLGSWKDSYQKASLLVGRMSLVEKVNITTGTGWATNLCVGNTGSAANAGFPMLCLQDGPLGIRFADHATVWPAGITTAATWNKALIYQRGKSLGREHRLKGVNVLLGPCMGPLGRMPAGGRNWEGFGPDPVLAGVASAETIKGIQDEGVMATAKHFVGNEQEHFRQSWEWGLPNAISSNIDDRTLHEVYLWPFADSIRAGVASVMCSYNMVNNSYACGNSKLMNGILKDELGFQGFVQSDWLAQRSGVASALAGLDMSMPGDGLTWNDRNPLWGSKLTEAVLNGSVPVERINDMTTRIVAAWYQLGQDDESVWPPPPPEGDGGPNFSSWTDDEIGKIHHDTDDQTTTKVNDFIDAQGFGDDFHGRLAQTIAAEGIVLVKNEADILPLKAIGWEPVETKQAGHKFRFGIFGEDAGPNPRGPNACPDRACNVGTLAQGWGSGAAEFPYLTTPLEALEAAFNSEAVEITSILSNSLSQKDVSQIKAQDCCIVFVNSDAGEGFVSWNHLTDRKNLFTQKQGDRLVSQVADNCEMTIVVVHAVGPVVVEKWIDHQNVKAVLLANLPGEESGKSLTDVLFGRLDACGRLPYTIGRSLSDYGPGGQIMYKPNGLAPQQDFKEGLLIDYRHYDFHNITPRFEFGFGLSYTTFDFSELKLETLKPKSPFPAPRANPTLNAPTYPTDIPDPSEALWPPDFRRVGRYIYPYLANTSIDHANYPYPEGYFDRQRPSPAGGGEGGNPSLYEQHIAVSCKVTNTGNRNGKQVVQIYVSFPSTTDSSTGKIIEFPAKVLRGFEKLELEPGETQTVTLNLTRRDLSYWSVGFGNWIMPDGDIVIHVGASSRNLPLNATW